MMAKKGRRRIESNLGSTGTVNLGTAVTTGASANTKGTPAQLIASTSFDAYWVIVYAANYTAGGAACRGCMDIMIGSSTEQVVIPNLLFGGAGTLGSSHVTPKAWEFPLYIPAGTRISCQAAGDRTATAFRVGIQLFGGDGDPGYRVGTRVDTYGIGTVPAATSITPGASGAEGSWTEIAASTTSDYFGVLPSFQNSLSSISTRTFTLDVGVGAATEELLQANFGYTTQGSEDIAGPWPSFAAPIKIPSGSRLAARMSNSSTNDGGYEVALHCIR